MLMGRGKKSPVMLLVCVVRLSTGAMTRSTKLHPATRDPAVGEIML